MPIVQLSCGWFSAANIAKGGCCNVVHCKVCCRDCEERHYSSSADVLTDCGINRKKEKKVPVLNLYHIIFVNQHIFVSHKDIKTQSPTERVFTYTKDCFSASHDGSKSQENTAMSRQDDCIALYCIICISW